MIEIGQSLRVFRPFLAKSCHYGARVVHPPGRLSEDLLLSDPAFTAMDLTLSKVS